MMPWQRVNLRRLTKLGTGHTPSRQNPEYWSDCTIPWLTLADVWQLRDGSIRTVHDTAEKISELGLANSAAVLHPAGTVAMSRTASVGFSCILGADMATSQDYVTWTCGPNLRPRYLLYALHGLRDEILGMRMGSTHQTIYMPDIERIAVPAPPVEAQDQIVAFLDAEITRIDTLIALRTRQHALVGQRIKAVVDDEYWQSGRAAGFIDLRYMVKKIEQGWSPQCENREAEPGEWGVIKAGCVNNGLFRSSQNKALAPGLAPRVAYEIRPGDLLMSRASGTAELIGSTAVVPEIRQRLLLCDKVYRLTLDDRKAIPSFISAMLAASAVRAVIQAGISGADGMANNLPATVIRNIPVPMLDVNAQCNVVSRLTERKLPLQSLANNMGRQAALLLERRQALIRSAVSGEMEVPVVRQ